MARVVVLCPEPIRPRMAGMGIRALRVAETLSRAGHTCSVGAPSVEPPAPASGTAFHAFGSAGLREALARADVAVASGHAGAALHGSRFAGAVVADLYDPFFVENLAYAATLGPRVFRDDKGALFELVDRADFILAASEEQRLLYLGLLLGRDRFSPSRLVEDPEARRLVAVAPFGVDEEDPGPARPHPALGPGEADVLFGGVYDWYDPGLVLDAWPAVLEKVPRARLLFVENPNPETTPQVRFDETRRRVSSDRRLSASVFFLPWMPYAERGGLYRACRVGVVAHRPSLETTLSFRTRVLDFLWASLPVVTTEGGGGATLVELSGAGRVVPPEPAPLAAALAAFLRDDALLAGARAKAASTVARFTWKETLRPLVDFVASCEGGARKTERRGGRSVLARLSRRSR